MQCCGPEAVESQSDEVTQRSSLYIAIALATIWSVYRGLCCNL